MHSYYALIYVCVGSCMCHNRINLGFWPGLYKGGGTRGGGGVRAALIGVVFVGMRFHSLG